MIRLAIPVSSSMVMKTTPLALPGRWRISTIPAIGSRRSTGRRARSAAVTRPSSASSAAQKGQRMALQGQAEAGVILDDMLAQRHLRQQRHGARFACRCGASSRRSPPHPALSPRWGARVFLWRSRGGEERQRGFAERLQRPQCAAAVEPDRAERVGLGQALERAAAEPAAPPQRLRVGVARAPRGDEPLGIGLGKPFDLAQAEAQRPAPLCLPLRPRGGERRDAVRDASERARRPTSPFPSVARWSPRSPRRAEMGLPPHVPSKVQSQKLWLTSTARTSTPCSRASRTICAGA